MSDKVVKLFFIVILLAGCSGNEVKRQNDLQKATSATIYDNFSNKKIVWDESIHIKIDGLNKAEDSAGFVEGKNIRGKFLFLNTGAEGNPVKKIGVYIDGNLEPLVALLIPGKSLSDKVISITGKADKECGAHYKYVVVMEMDNKLIANKMPFRTAVGDCGYNVNG